MKQMDNIEEMERINKKGIKMKVVTVETFY